MPSWSAFEPRQELPPLLRISRPRASPNTKSAGIRPLFRQPLHGLEACATFSRLFTSVRLDVASWPKYVATAALRPGW